MKTNLALLDRILTETFNYFNKGMDPKTGLILDKTGPGSPASIASVGLALSAYTVAVEKNLMSRAEAVRRTLLVLKFFESSEQSRSVTATGYKGFYYHFLNMKTGKRAGACELSTIDTAILLAGALTSSVYFDAEDKDEQKIREVAQKLYARADWRWALNTQATLSHGWKPESGFLPNRWDEGYSEAHLLYVLALGSSTHPIPMKGYRQWTSTFEWQSHYGYDFIYAGPLFIHQLSQVWLDLRGVQDEYTREKGIDYFENSRRATRVQQRYAIANPLHFEHYGAKVWGLSACSGPGPRALHVKGIYRKFLGYTARGAPYGPDDGTISPWAVISSLPFDPKLVLNTARHYIRFLALLPAKNYGFEGSFNPTFPLRKRNANGWVSPDRTGINQGPIILMIGNYENELIWKLSRRCPAIVKGLRRAGFKGGWLKKLKSRSKG